jgi:hypothetical protein
MYECVLLHARLTDWVVRVVLVLLSCSVMIEKRGLYNTVWDVGGDVPELR